MSANNTQHMSEQTFAACASSERPTRKRKPTNYNEDDEATAPTPVTPVKRRKGSKNGVTDVAKPLNTEMTPKKKAKKKAKGNDDVEVVVEEKRLKRHRKSAPHSYNEVKNRALTQRLTVLDRERLGTDEFPEENITIAGSTGNLYTVRITRVPSCDCPHAKKGNQCKHIIYVMLRVLKAREQLAYQLALLSSELRSIFDNAPPIPKADAEAASSDGNRKPIEGECPICYTDFQPKSEAIVYCKAACGNNVHKDCMSSWMTACRGKPTCPLCRAAWAGDEFSGKVNLKGATRGDDGYVNVASQLGLSGERDYSTYHSYWVRRHLGQNRGYG